MAIANGCSLLKEMAFKNCPCLSFHDFRLSDIHVKCPLLTRVEVTVSSPSIRYLVNRVDCVIFNVVETIYDDYPDSVTIDRLYYHLLK